MARQVDATTYARAEQLLPGNRDKMIVGGKVRPRWIDDGARFWYRRDDVDGHQFFVIDPQARTKAKAFDHERLAGALASASDSPVDAQRLPFMTIELAHDAVEFDTIDGHWRCDLLTYACTKVEDHARAHPLEVRSPDGRWAVVRRDHDLALRSLSDDSETALTWDGTADYAYGAPPDTLTFGTLMRRFGLPHLPPIIRWAPDSQRFITHRTDQRDLQLAYLVDSAPADAGRPVLHTYRYPLPGDPKIQRAELMVFDVEAGTTVAAKDEPVAMPTMSPITMQRVWWTPDSATVYYVDQPRDRKTLSLKRLDPLTGEVRTLVEERGEPRADVSQFAGAKPIMHVMSGERELLWWSQRDGWGHLYLYDVESGSVRNQVTSGAWVVQELLHVDESARVVYFIATGLIASHPYRRQVCRVGLDGSGFARLGADDLDHAVHVPDNKQYYVDSMSAVDMPPITTVRDWNGGVLVELEQAEVKGLAATLSPPEQFSVKAADGVTDIYGLIHLPHDFDPTRRYPVIDSPYPGPQHNRVMPSFDQGPIYDCESLAALGFVVVLVDGRGTPGRDKAFHDYSYGRLGGAGCLEDHVAAIEELARRRPWMDLDRVGIFGGSAGGYATVRAMCLYPDFYKVGVATCGNHDQRMYQVDWGETYDGPLHADLYAASSNVEIADRLQGKLLLMHGGMDDNVHPHQTLRLVERLIALDKDFDMVILPGAEHLGVGYSGYLARRKWDYFVRHLLDTEPPSGYSVKEAPLDFEAFAELLG